MLGLGAGINKSSSAEASSIASRSGASYLLDDYSGAAAAYSLRQLSSSYSGNAVKVRRSSDNTETDIGFVGGELDTASLSSFAGAGDAFVVSWYDQASTNDATQTTTANQPKIVSSGAVIVENGKPAVDFPNNCKLLSSISQAATDYAFVIVQKRNVNGGFFYDSESGRLIALMHTNGLYNTTTDGTIGSPDQGLSQEVQFLSLVSPSSGALYVNGGGSQTGLTYTQTGLGGITSLGSNYNSFVRSINAFVQEVIVYPSDQTSNRTNIESNINTFYSIY